MLKNFFISQESQVIKLRQYVLAGSLFSIAVLGTVFIFLNFDQAQPSFDQIHDPQPAKEIESSGTRVKPEDLWRFDMEKENKKLQDSLKEIKEALDEKTPKVDIQKESLIQQLQDNIAELQSQLSSKMAPSMPPPAESDQINQESHGSRIQKISFNTFGGSYLQKTKTVLNTIPAGAFARSILLSGLDTSAAMSAASDPKPLLLRIIDPGILPRKFKSDLKDCHVTASAYGDLSSERIYGRLEKLTCTVRKTGEIIETQVAGYIAGPDGKAGIRGKVVSKDSAFLERSLIGGLFSGLSNMANPTNRQSMVNPFAAGNPKVDAPSAKDMFTSGMSQGATNALDRLSQYYISRAEQLQPVIQIAGGQVVDIVFTEGTIIGSQRVKEQIAQVRDAHTQPSAPHNPQTLTSESSHSIQNLPLGDNNAL